MLNKVCILLLSIFLIFISAEKSFGQWNLFGEERTEEFNLPGDSTDIYKTIKEEFGQEEKEKVQEHLTNYIYKFKFDKYLEGKNASEIVDLVNTVEQEIETYKDIQDNYNAVLQHKVISNIVGEQVKYFIEFKSLFKKQISEIDLSIWFYAYRNTSEGVIRVSKKNISLNTNEEIQIPINRDKILEKNGGRKRFKYRIKIERIGFSDFTSFKADNYRRAFYFMKPSELKKLLDVRISSEL